MNTPAATPVTRLKRLARALAALGFIGVATVLLLEVLVAVFMPQPAPMLWLEAGGPYGHVMKRDYRQRYAYPGHDFVMDVRTNSEGFRDDEFPAPETGTPRIVFLGDSFTFGQGINVEDRMDRQLARMADAQGMSLQTLNLGVSAWGTLQATRYVRDHFEALAPDIVVLTFHDNDPSDDTLFLERGVSFDRVKFPGKNVLRRYSHLFRLLQHQYLLHLKRRYFNQKQDGNGAVTAPEPARETEQMDILQTAGPLHPITAAEWERTRSCLLGFAEDFRKFRPGATLVIQYTRPWAGEISGRLRDLADHEAIHYLDLAGAAAELKPEQQRLPHDAHWGPAMHGISAGALLDFLARQ